MRPPASPSCRLYEPEAVGAIGAYAPEGSGNGECGSIGQRELRAEFGLPWCDLMGLDYFRLN
jgi:hypothetical protein